MPQFGRNELIDASWGNRITWGGGKRFNFEKRTFPRKRGPKKLGLDCKNSTPFSTLRIEDKKW